MSIDILDTETVDPADEVKIGIYYFTVNPGNGGGAVSR